MMIPTSLHRSWGCLLCVIAALGWPLPTGKAQGTDRMKGIAYQSYVEGTYADRSQDEILDFVSSTGADWISFNTPFIYDSETGLIAARRGTTDFDGLPTALVRAKARHLKTALYVFVQTPTFGSLYADTTQPRDTDDFFRQFGNLLSGYADLAQRENVDLLILGNEMNAISGPAFREQWVGIIRMVRSRYAGMITYNAIPPYHLSNPTLSDVSSAVSFWDELDYLGFSVWPRLSNREIPTREEAERGWTTNVWTGSNYLQNLKAWSRLTGKPVVFVEIGYPSVNGAAINPGNSPAGKGVPNPELQAMLYDVMFSQLSKETGSWFAGMFLWSVDTWNQRLTPGYYTGGYRAVDFSFAEKQARDVVRRWFSGVDGRSIWPTSAASQRKP